MHNILVYWGRSNTSTMTYEFVVGHETFNYGWIIAVKIKILSLSPKLLQPGLACLVAS